MSTILKTGQVSVSTTATKLFPVNAVRRRVYLTVPVGSSVYLGSDATVSTTNGFQIGCASAGTLPDRVELNLTGEIWAIAASGTVTTSYLEESA